MGKIIGIDLGTTNSLAAVWENGESKLIPNSYGDYLTPSVVSVDEDGTVYVGKIAKERLITHPELTASVFKRNMGLKKIYKLGKKEFTPEELSSMVLRRLKEDAERYLGETVEEAIISVPAYFNDMGRNATKRAGRLAGLKVERIINEPSAAALACNYNGDDAEATVLVVDFGGGTLDVSLVDCFDNLVEIMAVSGNNHLGGHDFDEALAEYFLEKMQTSRRKISEETYGLLLREAEKCKIELSEEKSAHLKLQCDELSGDMEIDRKELVNICGEIFDRIAEPINSVLRDGRMGVSELTHIVLVGGSCKMKVVQQYLRYVFQRKDMLVRDPDHMVALGTGVCAGIKERAEDVKDMLLTDICPFSLGVNVVNRLEQNGDSVMSFLVERNSPLPISKKDYYVTVYDGQTQIDIGIYQGENYYAKDNIKLGELNVKVPARAKGQAGVWVRFPYDLNGGLAVDTEVPLSHQKQQLVIINKEIRMSEEEIRDRLAELEQLKLNPLEEEENKFALEWGMRLYAQCNAGIREELEKRMQYFVQTAQRDPRRAERVRKQYMVYLAFLEKALNAGGIEQMLGAGADWYNDDDEDGDNDWKGED
ncbi:MAG: molecular chaperone HscC [Lachnospiraceae bacterium]|nr:molecular chaperone HscC [Lachnospiraceae bacterium]